MGETWATFGADLHLDLPPRGTSGVRNALIGALRDAVRSGRLTPGTRLPSSRSLAADLGLARNTVADAYGELVAEGWLTARQGSGTRVARRAEPVAPTPAHRAGPPAPGGVGNGRRADPRGPGAGTPTAAGGTGTSGGGRGTRGRGAGTSGDGTGVGGGRAGTAGGGVGRPGGGAGAPGGGRSGGAESPGAASGGGASRPGRRSAGPRPSLRGAPPRPVHSLMPGSPDVSAFPRAAWLSAARRALSTAPGEAFGYGDPAGRPELRRALADYLGRARGVRVAPDRIVICAGFVQGLMLVGRALAAMGVTTVAVDSYGLDFHWDLITGAGLRTVPLPKDEHGTRVGQLESVPEAGAVLLTPAHHFPTGRPLSPDRRAGVVDWARRTGGLILEDDYDGEFRYDRQPVGALQGLDPERVVYLGTASKSLAPGLRLAWMVLPQHLVGEVLAAKNPAEQMTGTLDQLTLAEFITGGAYDRHLRGMRLRYRRRRDQLVAAVAERAPHIAVTGVAAGLHAVLELPPGTEDSVVRAAAWQGLALEGLHRYRYDATAEGPDGLVVGYGAPADHAFGAAIEALCRVLP